MPEKTTLRRARRARKEGKAATTQAGEFVREEMEHAKRGKHPVKSRKQAIAIGLSKARRSGVKVPPKKATRSPSRTAGARSSRARVGGAGKRARGKSRARPSGSRRTSARRSR
ncbi:DUF6496 domain-containing protein [Anaeromyxobacter oryzisoli]|uniref:DUF6496 domain-containing protein n=1 Tax=Anaeromyxobacter oryzisoli TaxID=2925408 RepID=UPI001F5695D6|nr:DUF6496 domain-containing protein [Anaeromyxobacter sp. SG63]